MRQKSKDIFPGFVRGQYREFKSEQECTTLPQCLQDPDDYLEKVKSPKIEQQGVQNMGEFSSRAAGSENIGKK